MEGRSVTQANPFLRNVSKYFLLACRACQQLLPMHLAELLLNVWVELLTYLLTHSMVQSPSWEANWFAASQEIPRISRNPKVNFRTHKCPPPVSILGQPNPVHIPTSHILEAHPNIIHPSTPRSPQWTVLLAEYNRQVSRLIDRKNIAVNYSMLLLRFQRPDTCFSRYVYSGSMRSSLYILHCTALYFTESNL